MNKKNSNHHGHSNGNGNGNSNYMYIHNSTNSINNTNSAQVLTTEGELQLLKDVLEALCLMQAMVKTPYNGTITGDSTGSFIRGLLGFIHDVRSVDHGTCHRAGLCTLARCLRSASSALRGARQTVLTRRISHSGSRAHYQGVTRNHVLKDPYANVVFLWAVSKPAQPQKSTAWTSPAAPRLECHGAAPVSGTRHESGFDGDGGRAGQATWLILLLVGPFCECPYDKSPDY